MDTSEYIYRRALWFMLPNANRTVYIEDLPISQEDLENFRARKGRWEPVRNFFGLEEKPPRYDPNQPVPQCGPALAYAYAYQPFELEEELQEEEDEIGDF